MPDSNLFRKEAMAYRGKTEPLDGLLRVTAPHEWVIVIGLAVALVAVALWAFIGRVDQTFATGCVLAHPGDRQAVISTVTGSVDDVLVTVGDVVETGQPLAHISAPDLGQHVALSRARARVAALEGQADAPPEALALAIAELRELEAAQQASLFIVSTHPGTVTSHSLAVGQEVTSGMPVARILSSNDKTIEAMAFLSPSDARSIEAGMEATIAPGTEGNTANGAIDGEVSFVADRLAPPPSWLSDFGLSAPSGSHLVRISLPAGQPQLRDGDVCTARIVKGSEPPIGLLNSVGLP